MNETPNSKKGKKKQECTRTWCVWISCGKSYLDIKSVNDPSCHAVLIAGCSALAFITCAALFVTYGITQNLNNQDSTTSLYYENTTVILAEVYNLFTSSLRVTEDTKHIGDFYRDIEIHQVDFSCTNLPTRIRQMANITNESDISAINGTTFYALDLS